MSSPIFLDSVTLQYTIREALENKKPLSIVRVGDGENIVLAQDVILTREEYMNTSVGMKWPDHGSGVKLPDPAARDLVAKSLIKVNIVGILPHDDRRIYAPKRYKRALTDRVFKYYNIKPEVTFDAYLFRDLLSTTGFWKTMSGRKIVIISKWGEEFSIKVKAYEGTWGFRIVRTLMIQNFYEIYQVLDKLVHIDFDVALLAAGVGSIVMAQRIADCYGKVAIDVGKGISAIAMGLKSMPLPNQPLVQPEQPNWIING